MRFFTVSRSQLADTNCRVAHFEFLFFSVLGVEEIFADAHIIFPLTQSALVQSKVHSRRNSFVESTPNQSQKHLHQFTQVTFAADRPRSPRKRVLHDRRRSTHVCVQKNPPANSDSKLLFFLPFPTYGLKNLFPAVVRDLSERRRLEASAPDGIHFCKSQRPRD